MLLLIILLLFLTFSLLFFYFGSRLLKERRELLGRLDELHPSQEEIEELNLPFRTRVLQPMVEKMERLWGRLTPEGVKRNIVHRLQMAGSSQKNGISGWMTYQIMSLIGFPAAAFVLLNFLDLGLGAMLFLLLISLVAGYMFPNIGLKNKILQRQKEIQKTLPDVIDLVTVSVEAGLTFDAAISKVGDKMPGHLARLLQRVLQEIKMGKPRKSAFKDMAMETGVEDLINFINAVVQADQLGVSIANILRVQSIQMREKRRQRIQEVAMKAPVKMLIPMVLFIFPTIFIILMGPAVLILIELFTK